MTEIYIGTRMPKKLGPLGDSRPANVINCQRDRFVGLTPLALSFIHVFSPVLQTKIRLPNILEELRIHSAHLEPALRSLTTNSKVLLVRKGRYWEKAFSRDIANLGDLVVSIENACKPENGAVSFFAIEAWLDRFPQWQRRSKDILKPHSGELALVLNVDANYTRDPRIYPDYEHGTRSSLYHYLETWIPLDIDCVDEIKVA